MTRLDEFLRAEAWREGAACREVGPPFFNLPVWKARQDGCNHCTVRSTCLAYALANKMDFGTWGGESERTRRRMLRPDYPYDKLLRRLKGAPTDLLQKVHAMMEEKVREIEKRETRKAARLAQKL